MKNSIVVSIATAFALLAYCPLVKADVHGDYNVGGAVGSSFEIGGKTTASGGLFANGEFVFLDKTGSSDLVLKDVVFVDGRLTSFIGGGAALGAGDIQGLFHLKLMGSLSGGLVVYQILPVNIGVEDANLEIRGNEVLGSALIGTTVVLPVSLLAGMDGTSLYIGVTAGMRLHSEIQDPTIGIQPKIRFVTDRVSVEAKALFSVGSDEGERKASLMTGINSVFAENDQIGLMATWDEITRLDQKTNSSVGILIYYGRNL